MNPLKLALASAFEASRLSRVLLQAQRLAGPSVRALNYHDVPAAHADAFEEQLLFYVRHFVPVGYDDLLCLHAGNWPHDKPGILLSFDDGFQSHARVVAPLLERHGIVGWFFVPVGQIVTDGADAKGQGETAGAPMSWRELENLAQRHVVGCHTMTHRRLAASLTETDLALEIREAKQLLEKRLGRPVPVFCWVGGEEWTYSTAAARMIHEQGFRMSFMTNNSLIRPGCDLLQLQRTNVEAWFPMSVTRFQISGFLDVLYTAKRRRVNRLTKQA